MDQLCGGWTCGSRETWVGGFWTIQVVVSGLDQRGRVSISQLQFFLDVNGSEAAGGMKVVEGT